MSTTILLRGSNQELEEYLTIALAVHCEASHQQGACEFVVKATVAEITEFLTSRGYVFSVNSNDFEKPELTFRHKSKDEIKITVDWYVGENTMNRKKRMKTSWSVQK